MTQASHLIGTWLLFALWQSTLVLTAALLIGRLFHKTPWRSHDLHLFGIIAAVSAPTFSTIIASQNGGWFAAGRYTETFTLLFRWSNMLGMLLLVGMVLFAVILIRGIVASRKLMFRAKPFPNRESQEALLRSAETLQNVSLPILFTSPSVKSPTVWCWGLHPAVVLPEELADNLPVGERDAIFLHELGHITRRDHLTALLTRICGAFLFWNPLYWLALIRADLAADEACDLLVLSRGNVSPETYTETLLRLAAGECYKPAFQFLSRKEKIMKRITTILDFGDQPMKPSAKASRLWQCSVLMVALLLSVTLAFCQEKKESRKHELPFTSKENLTHIITFAPAGDFKAGRFDDLYEIFYPVATEANANWMFSKMASDKNGNQIFLCLTDDPEKLQAVIDSMPELKFLKSERLSQDSYEKHTAAWKNREKSSENQAETDSSDTNIHSLLSILTMEGVKASPVHKHIIDFPDDGIDLSTPENAYATMKHLIISNREDKYEQLSKLTKGNPPVPEREKVGDDQITDAWREIYKKEFLIYEVLVFEDKLAFVWGQRQFDGLYDGNYFIKENNQWLNMGNEQCMTVQEMAERVVNPSIFPSLAVRLTGKSPIWTTPDNVGHTHLVGFAPVGDFAPQTPGELLEKLNETLLQTQNVVTGYFRTWPKDGRLIGAICTNNPSPLRRIIEEIPELELIGVKQLDEKMFNAHQRKPQLSLNDDRADETKSPKILKMEPANGADNVDAGSVSELRVTFDRDMNTGGFSWCGGGETYPETTGDPKWIDKRTCVLPVKLQPGKEYMLGINSQKFRNFKSAGGVPVVPVVYTFKTK